MNKEKQIAVWKRETVEKLTDLMNKYETILVIDLTNLPSFQLQKMRAQLRGKALIAVTRAKLISLAIEHCKKDGIKEIKKYLVNIPGIVFSNIEPFRLAKILIKNKSSAPAKPGQIAPFDISIPAGPTPFTPGPVIGELGQLGIKTAIEGGKINIKESVVVVKDGGVISDKVATILSKLGIEPMEIGINLIAAYEKGRVYEKNVFDVDEGKYIEKIKQAYRDALSLSLNRNILTKDNIALLIKKACVLADNLARKINITVDKEVRKGERLSEVKKGIIESRPASDEEFKRDEMVARDILDNLQKEKVKSLSLPKQKEERVHKIDIKEVL